MVRWPLRDALALLERHYGRPIALPSGDPFELILWECCAYLVDDQRRARVYARLRQATNLRPERIAGMAPNQLQDLIAEDGGMRPAMRAEKLQRAANLALDTSPAELRALCHSDTKAARSILLRFPGIGGPGADRLLMIAGGLRSLAPESNGLRVLCRLGFGSEGPRYDRMYRSAVEAVEPELPNEPRRLPEAHQLLRQHGQTLCKRTAPRCGECMLRTRCPGAR